MRYAEEYCENYLEKIFYFCLRKTGNESEAEDLAGDISVDILSALNRGAEVRSFAAWVWKIARNRYAKWVEVKNALPNAADIDEIVELLPDGGDTEGEFILSEDKNLLRRELAFIRSDYRRILVAHYLEEKSVSVIARENDLPLGTVKTKLQNSRKQLKEGMKMAREFGKKSYAPEEISFISNMNKPGANGEPWSVIQKKLNKNILLEAYDNPSTAEQMSMELGVAMPYMEEALEDLASGTFLVKSGGKYETDFPIISASAQAKIHENNVKITPELTSLLENIVDAYDRECRALGINYYGGHVSYEDAKWTLLMRLYDKIAGTASRRADGTLCGYERTKRPGGGEWDIVGFQDAGLAIPPFVGLHGCFAHIDFGQFKFYHAGIYYRTPEHLTVNEGEALIKVCKGEWQDCDKALLDALENYGYILKTENGYSPLLLVFTERHEDTKKRFTATASKEIESLAEKVIGLFADSLRFGIRVIDADLPERIRKNAVLRSQACSEASHSRGYAVEQAVSDGWLKESAFKTLGAYASI